MKTNIFAAIILSVIGLNSFAESDVHRHLQSLDRQIEVARDNLHRTVLKTQKSIQNMELLSERSKQIAIAGLSSSSKSFLDNLESECFVVAIAGGAVGGSALSEDLKLCEIAKIKAKATEIRSLLSSISEQ